MSTLIRSKFPKQKDIIIINDVPIKSEFELGEKFSSASNLNLLTSFRTGRVNIHNAKPSNNHKAILANDIHTTYFDYTYYGDDEVDDNFDFNKEFRKKKDLKEISARETTEWFFVDKDLDVLTKKSIPKYTFYKLEHQKDVFISYRLKKCLDDLLEEIKTVSPKIIVVTGKWGLFFLTGKLSLAQTLGNIKDKKPLGGLNTYRASIMNAFEEFKLSEHLLIPIYHAQHAVSMPDKVPIMELDIQKIGWIYSVIKEKGLVHYKFPNKKFIFGTNKNQIINYLDNLLTHLESATTFVSCDIETMFKRIIDCIGLTDSINSGICVPFASIDNPNLWSIEDETEIMCKIREILLHPNCQIIGQNFNYDSQYIHKLWFIDKQASHDTMVLHHILYNYLPKDLAFLASLYCEHYCYWKDEIEASKETPERRWIYNIKDIQYTLEVLQNLLEILASAEEKLEELYLFQQQKLSPILVNIMNKGIRIDKEEKERLYKFFSQLMEEIVEKIDDVLGLEFNQNSTPQKKKLFTDFFGMRLKVKKKTGNETCDAASMLEYIEEYPLYKPFLTLLLEYASLKVFVNNFLGMNLDNDNRARTQYRIAGTATGRLASTKNVWGNGGNFQNIPEKGKIDLKVALQVIEEEGEQDFDFEYADLIVEGNIVLPNIKKIFIPDEGHELCDADLSGADAMIVAWDSECKWLIDFFTNPKGKLYAYIASEHLQREITSESPEYKPYKAVCHGSNYGLGLEKLSAMLNITYNSAKNLQDFYFGLCPEVRKWQDSIRQDIRNKGYISNIFGRRAWFLNRNDPTLFNKAFAFIPQSSIADIINRGMINIYSNLPKVQILLQVHDSIVTQYPIEKAEFYRQEIKKNMEILVPYKHPLIIPADFKVSTTSYGETKKIKKIA